MRPLQESEQPDSDIAAATAAKLAACGGSEWKDCRQQCGCMQSRAALKEKSGWPQSLLCVDPNARDTSVDVNRAYPFLSFAQERGWIIGAGHAAQHKRCFPYTTLSKCCIRSYADRNAHSDRSIPLPCSYRFAMIRRVDAGNPLLE